MSNYFSPEGGLPPQTQLLTDRAVVKEAYTVIPKGVLRDIVTSNLPGWTNTRAWIIARPIAGFATTFSQLIVEVAPGGGSDKPEAEAGVEGVIFLTKGSLTLTLDGEIHRLESGGYAYLAAGSDWKVKNDAESTGGAGGEVASFQWIRKAYEPLEGFTAKSFVTRDQDVEPRPMPGTNGAWATTRFVDPDDLAHDMHVNIVTFQPGASIPFAETHVMEHGLFVLEGKAVYRLNDDWVEVEAGDFMWLRAFCPQACYAGGPGNFRYLLYKDVNRQIRLT
ncbi:bifunctional allantoicase/(S)-ureidoglycine aminohydrolase [Pseudarthrobacter sp. S9]|uniref:bifunctional allantoicase/(S)-ureidoglycine aminohydrolase n=1 Tax=Pseudarthrobacter sp. S9 TaxID=3418421 RepID=UPI003CFF434F